MYAKDSIKLAIYGAGGFGREVAWLADACNSIEKKFEILCFIDDDKNAPASLNDIPVVNLDELAESHASAQIIAAVGTPCTRELLVSKAKSKRFEFATLVHPRVEMSRWVDIGNGTVICAGNILTTNITVGQHCQINLDCTIGHDVIIGDFTTLSPGVHVSGCVHIGKRVYIGTGAVIINGTQDHPLQIGDDAVIAAGACVIKSVPPGVKVMGIPAQERKQTK